MSTDDSSQRPVRSISLPPLAAFALALGLAGSTYNAATTWRDVRKQPDKNNIRITGSAKKRIVSDLIQWSATVESKGEDRTAAYVSLKGGTDKVVEFLKAQGIKPDDIKTQSASLSEQFETLHEAKQWVEGIALLEKILAASPDTTSNAAVNAFVAGLRKSEQLALHKEMGATPAASEDGIQAAEQTLGMLSSIVLQKRDSAIKAALQEPSLAPERMRELLEEAKEIAGLLRWTGRSSFNDELAPETKKAEKKPWEKWKK